MKNCISFISSDQVPANASLIFYIIFIVLFQQLEATQPPPPPPSPAIVAPLVASYNDKLRPLLDAVDQLRRLKITQEGISLPTIVVIGDQSSGKSSVLESLACISLPRGQGICTRVPLIMRLQHHSSSMPEIHLEYQGKLVRVDEDKIAEAITLATDEIAGNGKGISNVPITLVVKKSGVPDLTLIDLPGITRVPVRGQPDNIYEQISDIIMEYIKPEETIILNVLSATVDFPTCESIRMSQKVDKTGERTLAVVTKADKAPEGLLEKVTADDVNIGLGYICVRNRIGDESHEEARLKETSLFETHSLLSKIDKSMVGIPILAYKLAYIQSRIISKCLPNIVQKIKEKLNLHVLDLNKLPHHPATKTEAMAVFMEITGSIKDSLHKLLIAGEFDEYVDDLGMHSTARLSKMLNEFYNELQNTSKIHFLENFLVNEILVLEEANGIWLPNFIPRSTVQSLMRKKMHTISQIPVSFIVKVWDHIELVVVRVLASNCEHYPQLLFAIKRSAQNIITCTKNRFTERVMEIVEMETVSDYSCDPVFLASWAESRESLFHIMKKANWPLKIEMKGYGVIEARHLHAFREVDSAKLDQAFDLKMRMEAYWNIVVKRLVDYIALQLHYTIQNLVKKDMDRELVYDVVGGIEQMLEESPAIATKRERLKKSVEVLTNSSEVIERVMDMIVFLGD